ncbi:MAG: ABC transporter ATP-binding protein [Hominenteromicrobium sp.]
MTPLCVTNLNKTYPAFRLVDVSFTLEAGKITGFIGRNGAGKSTTIKSLFNLVHPDSGEIRFFGLEYEGHEREIKQRVGYVSGAFAYYGKKKLRTITSVTKAFYPNWDDAAYADCMRRFSLDENKTPEQLSAGMKVKYALTLALSHGAELLVLDEPTSGLDPVSREDLLELFLDLCDAGKTIFFSTHITSDLDKCADRILYIRDGRIAADDTLAHFVDAYRLVEADPRRLRPEQKTLLIGPRRAKHGITALIRAQDADSTALPSAKADLEQIMVHLEKEDAE